MKLVKLLKVLNKKETTAFKKYLKMLYHRQENGIKLLAYLLKFHPEFIPSKKLGFEQIHKVVFERLPENKKDTKNLSNLFSDLYQHLKAFLLWQESQKSNFHNEFYWTQILKERGVKTEKKTPYDNLLKQLSDKLGSEEYWQKHITYKLIYDYTEHKSELRLDYLDINQEYLNLYQNISNLKIICEKVNFLFHNRENQELLISQSELERYNQCPLSYIFTLLYKLLTHRKIKHYHEIKELLFSNEQIATLERYTILSYLLIFSTGLYLSGDTKFAREVFDLNEFGVEKHLFIFSGNISVSKFNNIVETACINKKTIWARNFVQQNGPFLRDNVKEDVALLSNARILLEEKKYSEAGKLLGQIKTVEPSFLIRTIVLTCKCNYEFNEDREFQIITINKYLRLLKSHKKIQEIFRERTIKFLIILRKILQKNTTTDSLILDVQKSTKIYLKSWLLNILNEQNE